MMSQKRIKRKVEWTIENVTREKLEGDKFELISETFVMTLGDNITKWNLQIDTEQAQEVRYLRTWLNKISVVRDDFMITLIFKLGVGDDLKKTNEDVESHIIALGDGIGCSQFLELDTLFDQSRNYLDKNSTMKLIVKVKLSYLDQAKPNEMKSRKTFSVHLRDEEFADFTLKSSEGRAFKVHRLVLAEKSDFFNRMLRTNMEEKNKGEAVLQDVNSDMLEEVIKFIYTGQVEIADSNKAKEMIDAAEELGLTDLKKICENQLLKDLNKENALEMLTTADMFNAKELEMKSLEIITSYFDTLKDTPGWKLLTNPLVMKIMSAFANKQETLCFRSVL